MYNIIHKHYTCRDHIDLISRVLALREFHCILYIIMIYPHTIIISRAVLTQLLNNKYVNKMNGSFIDLFYDITSINKCILSHFIFCQIGIGFV